MRALTPEDVPEVVALVVAAEMFDPEDAGFLEEALAPRDDGTTCVVEDSPSGPGLASVVLYRPEEAADRAFDLTMLAVHPALQGTGRGRALVRFVEDDLRARGQRLVVVRTSGTEQYAGTRVFYRRVGYTEHTRVPDYWTDGDDLVLFTTRL